MNAQCAQNINEELCLNRGILRIKEIIAEMDKEENLHLKKLQLTNFSPSLHYSITDALSRAHLSHCLKILTLHRCDIHPKDAQVVANFIMSENARELSMIRLGRENDHIFNYKSSTLSKLEILRCGTKGDAMDTIMNAVTQSSLCTLNFEGNHVQEHTTTAIIELLERPYSSFTKLSLSGCMFQCNELILILGAIKKSKLKTLMLDRVTFDDASTTAVIDCIVHSKLNKLSLCCASFTMCNDFAHKQGEMIAAIKQSSLKSLNVQDIVPFQRFNTINDLMLHSPITKFKFGYSARGRPTFSEEENIALIASMQRRNLFTHYTFNSTHLTDRLSTSVYNLLENSHLTSIDFINCSMFDAVLNKIFNSIKRSSIVSLHLCDRVLNQSNMLAICDLLENHHLEKLKLTFTDCTDEMMYPLLASIKVSSLTQFNMCAPLGLHDRVRDEIRCILQERRQNLNSCYGTKSARM